MSQVDRSFQANMLKGQLDFRAFWTQYQRLLGALSFEGLLTMVMLLTAPPSSLLTTCTLLLMSHPKRGFWGRKWGTYHFREIHICGDAPLSINAILPFCEELVAARITLCAIVNTYHPNIPETHQENSMKACLG